MSLTLYMEIREEVPAGIMMMGVLEMRLAMLFCGGLATLVGKGVEGCWTGGRAFADPSVTDFRFMP